MATKNQPFLRQLLNKPYDEVPFTDLKISTATIDVRLVDNAKIDFAKLFTLLPVVHPDQQVGIGDDTPWPPGTIVGAKFLKQCRGKRINKGTRCFKNSVTIWIWLKEKRICVKISPDSLHMTGCKDLRQAAECARYVQLHMQLLEEHGVYEVFPHVIRFDVCMINYNFNLGVGIDLVLLDKFICENYPKLFITPYDPNMHGTTMPLRCPLLLSTYTVHGNGQICMCVSEIDIEQALINIAKSHDIFYTVMSEYRK